MAPHHDLLHLAESAAVAAGRYIRSAEHPANPGSWDTKAASDFVTAVDRESERLITEILTDGVPGAVVMGEELAPDAPSAAVRWIVDPLDGTTNYLHGFPAYAVSIAAEADGRLAAGVVLDVTRDRLYGAVAGGGAFCGGERLAVSTVADPRHALLGTGFPFKHPAVERLDEYVQQFTALLPQTAGIRRAGSAALDLAYVAEGRFDAFWELWLAPWDMAAGILLVREAGGMATDLDGAERGVEAGAVVAGNPAMHAWLVEQLRSGNPSHAGR